MSVDDLTRADPGFVYPNHVEYLHAPVMRGIGAALCILPHHAGLLTPVAPQPPPPAETAKYRSLL